jgi:hypothetical protein
MNESGKSQPAPGNHRGDQGGESLLFEKLLDKKKVAPSARC